MVPKGEGATRSLGPLVASTTRRHLLQSSHETQVCLGRARFGTACEGAPTATQLATLGGCGGGGFGSLPLGFGLGSSPLTGVAAAAVRWLPPPASVRWLLPPAAALSARAAARAAWLGLEIGLGLGMGVGLGLGRRLGLGLGLG